MLNKQKGNMYGFVTHTWNAIKGKCPHDCSYCYMKSFKQNPVRLDKTEFKTDLGEGNIIFVGSSCDMFAKDIPQDWIFEVLAHCVKYPKNKYLFQSKDTSRIYQLRNYIPHNSIIGTTIETNITYPDIMKNSPSVQDRAFFMNKLFGIRGFKTMVTIEPIMTFDLNELVQLIRISFPSWVNVGADSKGHKLPEPTQSKILRLIIDLEEFTEVKMKKNLKRLCEVSGDSSHD